MKYISNNLRFHKVRIMMVLAAKLCYTSQNTFNKGKNTKRHLGLVGLVGKLIYIYILKYILLQKLVQQINICLGLHDRIKLNRCNCLYKGRVL